MSQVAPVRVALVGAGLIARRSHIPAYQAASEAIIAGLAAATPSEAQTVAAQFGIGRVFDSWQEAVDSPDVDAIDVCTPNALHAPIAIAAARAGKHVLVEKPMTTSLADAGAMVAAARQAGVHLMVAHNLRWAPVYRAVYRALREDQALGRLYSVRGVFMHAGPDESWGSTSDWFWREDGAGGGSLLDLGIHMIDIVRWVVGRPVAQVSAMTARFEKPTFADDNVIVALRFEDGPLAVVQSSWTARPNGDRELVVQGERGQLAVGRSRNEPVVIHRKSGEGVEKLVPELPPPGPDDNPFVHFVRSIQRNQDALVTGEEGRDTLAIALAAYESARAQRVVSPGSA